MKIFKIIAIWVTLLVVSVAIESCFNCPETFSFQYSLSSFEIHPIDKETIMSLMGNGRSDADSNPLVFRKDFGVEIKFIADIKLANSGCAGSFFMQSAYAWSCEPDYFYPKNSIVSIQVFSDKDFGEKYPAGSNIAEFFQIREWPGGYYEETPFPWLTSFEEYFKRPAPVFSSNFDYSIICLLTATTIEAGEYKFNFVIKLSDDRIIEQSITAVLQLQKKI